MKWKLVSVVALFAVAILAVVLVFTRHSQAQAINPTPAAYSYKVEHFIDNDREKLAAKLERRLNDNGRNGWHVVAMGPYTDTTLFVVLEKPASAP